MQKWRDELLENASVDLDIVTNHLPAHVLALGSRDISDGSMEDWLERSHRDHASALGYLLKLVDHLGELAILGYLVRFQVQLRTEHVADPQLRGRHLADKPVELVNSRDGDLKGCCVESFPIECPAD